jgi:hypothetical protein
MSYHTWEYRVLPVASETTGGEADTLEAQLDELGVEGWELVAVDPSVGSSRYVLKRPVLAAPGEEEYEEGDVDDDDDEYDEDGTIRIGPSRG